MQWQVTSLSPHQNGKVIGVLFAVISLVFVIPFLLVALVSGQAEAFPSMFMVILVPVIYLGLGYIMVFVTCALYNRLFGYIGGIEFESQRGET